MKNKLILMGLLFITIFGKTLCSDPRSTVLNKFVPYVPFESRGEYRESIIHPVIVREGTTYPDGKKLGVPTDFICHVGRAFEIMGRWFHGNCCEKVRLYISPHHSDHDDIVKGLTAALCLSKEGYGLRLKFKGKQLLLTNVLDVKFGQDEARRRDFEEYVEYYKKEKL